MSHWSKLAGVAVREMSWALCKAVPPIDPDNTYWLDSDATYSYCWDCAVKARAKEFGLGMPIGKPVRWSAAWRTDLEDAFYQGIDGCRDGHTDSTEACETCSSTLSYILTDEGVQSEIECFLACPVTELNPETTYALDRLSLNIWERSERKTLIAVFSILKLAIRLMTLGKTYQRSGI